MAQISIQMMEHFDIYVGGRRVEQSLSKSRKGLGFLQMLVLADGEQVSNQRLLSALWSDENNKNPESALKTLVSRVRTQLNQVSEGLGRSIAADSGAYHWEQLPGVTVDALEIEAVFNALEKHSGNNAKQDELYQRLLRLYVGDFMQSEDVDMDEWSMSRAVSLHTRYMNAVFSYLNLLKAEEKWEQVMAVCREALEVDGFNERLHMELITALVKTNRPNDAMMQYKSAEQVYYRYLGQSPSEELEQFYRQIEENNRSLDFSLQTIAADMKDTGREDGAYVCEYVVFKEIYNLQVRNVKRQGLAMNLVVIQVSEVGNKPWSSLRQDNLMQSLIDILRYNLRRGDLITRYSVNMVALLLPMNDPSYGTQVMERLKRIFYSKHSAGSVTFKYRIGCLTSDMGAMLSEHKKPQRD